MASTSEVGHAKNVANFYNIISFVQGYGTNYNPTKANLKIAALQDLHAQAETSISAVQDQKTLYDNSINNRVQNFEDLKTLSTRLMNALGSTDASEQTIDDAKSYNRKIQGKRTSKVEEPTNPNQEAPKTNSTSQQSYDQLTQHFAGLVSVLENEPSYSPNEPELQIATLKTKIAELKSSNNTIAQSSVEISNARIARDKMLYNPENGLVETASDVKNYVKSLYGVSSAEYQQISALRFRSNTE